MTNTHSARRAALFGLAAIGLALTVGACDRIGGPHVRGERLLKRGDYAGALLAYNEAIAQGDHLAVAYANRCFAQQSLGHDEEAVHDCTESLKLDPNQYEVLNNRAVAYLELHTYPEALADFEAALKLKPDYPEVYANRGKLHIEREEYKEAEDDLTKAIEMEKASDAALSDAYANRAMAEQNLNESQKALADYGKAIDHGADPRAYFDRGMLYLQFGYMDYAYEDFKAAVAHVEKGEDVYMMAQANMRFLEGRPKGLDPRTGATMVPAEATRVAKEHPTADLENITVTPNLTVTAAASHPPLGTPFSEPRQGTGTEGAKGTELPPPTP